MTDRDSTTAALDRLRDANPVPGTGNAPPFADVLARVEASPSRTRVGSLLVPLVGVAVALAVVLVIGLSLSSDRNRPALRRPAAGHGAQTHTPRAPSGGMPGLITPTGFGFAPGGAGFVSFVQCQPDRRCGCCGPGSTAGSVHTNWLATTTDGRRSWHVAPSSFSLIQPVLTGRDGWALGSTGGRTAVMFVSHDGGLRWTVARTAVSPEQPVSVAAGEAWSVGADNRTMIVMHGATGGSALLATARQPASGDHYFQVVAGGAGTAYVYTYASNGSEARPTFVTRDDGRTWQPIAAPCPVGYAPAFVSAGGPEALWAGCDVLHVTKRNEATGVLLRSDDGGRHWRVLPQPSGGMFPVHTASASVAWAADSNGDILRTTDGGAHWTKVWTVSGSQPHALAGYLPQLALESQNADSAAILVLLTGGSPRHPKFTNFVIYRTTNAGRSWTPTVVALPR
jgi:photosystem II stability/assembly factor-like uncharacterized protein